MENKGGETSLIICGNLVKSASILEENTMIVNTPIFCLKGFFLGKLIIEVPSFQEVPPLLKSFLLGFWDSIKNVLSLKQRFTNQ